MYTERGILIDLDDVRKLIAQADVFAMGVRASAERVLVDTRTNATDGPLITLVPPVANLQERMQWLRRRRPRFAAPERFAFFVWPHSMEFLTDTGIWGNVVERLSPETFPEAAQSARRLLRDLRRIERAATRAAITGENHRTLWQAGG